MLCIKYDTLCTANGRRPREDALKAAGRSLSIRGPGRPGQAAALIQQPPSDPVMRIVPENDRLIARVRVSPVDIGKTSLGQTAVLRFSAFNQDHTPQFDGRVIAVSVVAVIDDGDRRRLLRSDGRNPG